MEPLLCLHDGSWISPRSVTGIIPRMHDDGATVLVCMGDQRIRIGFETEGAAVRYAAELADAINAARSA